MSDSVIYNIVADTLINGHRMVVLQATHRSTRKAKKPRR